MDLKPVRMKDLECTFYLNNLYVPSYYSYIFPLWLPNSQDRIVSADHTYLKVV